MRRRGMSHRWPPGGAPLQSDPQPNHHHIQDVTRRLTPGGKGQLMKLEIRFQDKTMGRVMRDNSDKKMNFIGFGCIFPEIFQHFSSAVNIGIPILITPHHPVISTILILILSFPFFGPFRRPSHFIRMDGIL
jgi:hypothetical protein